MVDTPSPNESTRTNQDYQPRADISNEHTAAFTQVNTGKNHYEILGVSQKATDDEIRTAYKKIAFMVHPDRNNSSEESRAEADNTFKKLNAAYEILKDHNKRALYDIELREGSKNSANENQPRKESSQREHFQQTGRGFDFKEEHSYFASYNPAQADLEREERRGREIISSLYKEIDNLIAEEEAKQKQRQIPPLTVMEVVFEFLNKLLDILAGVEKKHASEKDNLSALKEFRRMTPMGNMNSNMENDNAMRDYDKAAKTHNEPNSTPNPNNNMNRNTRPK